MDFNKSIRDTEEKIGYTFRDKSLIKQAFTRTTFCNEHRVKKGAGYESNEVLEFFGDSVLSAAIVTLFMRDFTKRYENGISTKLSEGDFSNIKSKLSDKTNLSAAIKKAGLQKHLLTGNGDREKEIEEASVAEDLFESIIGAVYIDSGNSLAEVIGVVERMLDIKDYLKTPPIQSFKNALQEFCADKKRRLAAPVYKTVSESGPDHSKTYERACYIGERLVSTGLGRNQKAADTAAAENALKILVAEEEKSKQKVTKKQAQMSPVQKLREYAAKNKKPSPEYRDHGEISDSSSKTKKFKIECRFAGLTAFGTAESKATAKLIAAEEVLSLLKSTEKKKKKATK